MHKYFFFYKRTYGTSMEGLSGPLKEDLQVSYGNVFSASSSATADEIFSYEPTYCSPIGKPTALL